MTIASDKKIDAIFLAEQGLYVFPLRSGSKGPFSKTEIGGGWKECSTNDPAKIIEWINHYRECNFGVDCEKSGLFVIDVDNKNGKNGSQELERLELNHGRLPATFITETPSGGFHYYFRGSGKSTQDRLSPGIDTKSRGGYVVAPGSSIDGKHYTNTTNFSIAEVPTWIIEMAGQGAAGQAIPNHQPLAENGRIQNIGRLYAALSHIPADDYQIWVKVGMGIHHSSCGSYEGLDLWDTWSQKSSKWEPGECQEKWATFKGIEHV